MSNKNAVTESVDVRPVVDQLLLLAVDRGASDIHIDPGISGYEIRFRIDGLLETVQQCAVAVGRSITSRLMVMAQLLTYRLDIPQEGKFLLPATTAGRDLNLRLAVMPTTHGLRAAVRLPAELLQPKNLEELGLPARVLQRLQRFAVADSGMLILTGPAGSGKTTTVYALLEYIVRTSPGLSIVTLEDPVERDLAGVTQIEISPFGQLTYERALRSMLRQDPQVLMLGEIRDAATATLALQAALSGHRLICTFHASTPAGAVSRLIEMGAEPYQISSAIQGIVSQRLLRRAAGRGRVPIAEFVEIDQSIKRAISDRQNDEALLSAMQSQADFQNLRQAAAVLVQGGIVTDEEVQRVLGPASSMLSCSK
jgi:type II secretory ATPase GspE/PulE/Tfp pilus assembly ATPase PilB-like protein